MKLKIALFQPEIPHNAGAAIRLCAGMSAELHLIRPLGFQINDRHLERVALGYHDVYRPILHDNLKNFLSSLPAACELYFFSSKAVLFTAKDSEAKKQKFVAEMQVGEQVALLFGSETAGLCCDAQSWEALWARGEAIKIPQAEHFRCHNLSNSIAMAAYEVLRQWDFPALS